MVKIRKIRFFFIHTSPPRIFKGKKSNNSRYANTGKLCCPKLRTRRENLTRSFCCSVSSAHAYVCRLWSAIAHSTRTSYNPIIKTERTGGVCNAVQRMLPREIEIDQLVLSQVLRVWGGGICREKT